MPSHFIDCPSINRYLFDYWLYLLCSLWRVSISLIVSLINLIIWYLLMICILLRSLLNGWALKLLMELGLLIHDLLWVMLIKIRIFSLRLRLLVKRVQVVLESSHMRVSLVLSRVKMMLISALLILLVHFSAIKFIILNYNFSTASP